MRNSLLLVVLLSGCTSSSEEAGDHVDLVSVPYTLQPGEEKYFCYTTRLPADRAVAITKITPKYGVGTHHILASQTIATEPEGFSECNVLIRTTWIPLYTGGLNSGALQLPDGIGFRPLERGQQILMQLHLQNATDEVITDTTSLRLDFVDQTAEIQPASIYGLDNRKISVPPHSNATTAMSCAASKDLEVFAVLGHMHKQGVHLDFSRGASAGTEMLYEEAWKFEEQPVTLTSFRVTKGDNLHLRCTHKNDGNTTLLYGESSDTEMCSFVMYYAPATGLDGCINE
jgi:hypothetical protein